MDHGAWKEPKNNSSLSLMHHDQSDLGSTVKERNANSVYQFKYPILKEMFLRLILVSVTTLCKKQHFINFYFKSYINSLIHKQTSYIFSYVLFVNGKSLSINF